MLPCLVTIETPIIGELADVMSELQHPYHISNLQCMADCSSSSKLNSPLPACLCQNKLKFKYCSIKSSSCKFWLVVIFGKSLGDRRHCSMKTWHLNHIFHFNFCSSFQQVFGDVTSAWKTFTWTSMLWKLWRHTHTHLQIYSGSEHNSIHTHIQE